MNIFLLKVVIRFQTELNKPLLGLFKFRWLNLQIILIKFGWLSLQIILTEFRWLIRRCGIKSNPSHCYFFWVPFMKFICVALLRCHACM